MNYCILKINSVFRKILKNYFNTLKLNFPCHRQYLKHDMQIDYLPHYHNHLTLNQTTLNQSPTPLFKWSKFLFRALACKKKYVF